MLGFGLGGGAWPGAFCAVDRHSGSGRVPAGFNQIVGLKPTPGAVSGTGLAPACRTLDCIGILALNVADSALALSIMEGARRAGRLFAGPPRHPQAPAPGASRSPSLTSANPSADYEAAFAQFADRLQPQVATLQTLAFDTLFEVAKLLYYGPWVAERVVGARSMYEQPEALLPVIRQVLDKIQRFNAADTFAAQYRLQALQQEAEKIWQTCGCAVRAHRAAPPQHGRCAGRAGGRQFRAWVRTPTS